MTTTTPVTLITGNDAQGNEITYLKSSFVEGGWIDASRECAVGKSYIDQFVLPNVVKVRFGDVEISRAEWLILGAPFERDERQMADLRTIAAYVHKQAEAGAGEAELGTHVTIEGREVVEFGSKQWFANIEEFPY